MNSTSFERENIIIVLKSQIVAANDLSVFQSISGLRLTDTFLKRTYEYDDIAQVCVVCPYTSNEC